jgi:hypothetical protein
MTIGIIILIIMTLITMKLSIKTLCIETVTYINLRKMTFSIMMHNTMPLSIGRIATTLRVATLDLTTIRIIAITVAPSIIEEWSVLGGRAWGEEKVLL